MSVLQLVAQCRNGGMQLRIFISKLRVRLAHGIVPVELLQLKPFSQTGNRFLELINLSMSPRLR